MKIAFNPSTVAALTAPPNNKDITFDLRGRNIFARGVKFQGTDTNTWRSIQVNGISIGTNTLNIVGATTSTKDGITSIITKDTWRQIKINNVSIGTNILDLRNGSNTTLTNSNGVVTINSTWRPVVDSLTSDSTTSSLSAKQGKVLAGLINGKSDSGHTHDGRYVRAFGTTNDDIDSDWGQSFKTFDPIPSGTPPEKNPNISLLSIGGNFNRRKQLAFIHSNDNIYYRRHVNGSFTDWRRLAFANEIPSSLKNPHALTISLNGTSQGPYDGSAAKSINITPGSIGAATSGHNHDGRYVRAFGTTNDDIDSDWGQSFKTFDPIPSGTPPEKNPNISLLSIGGNFNRRKQLAFIHSNDNIYYRRHVNGSFTDWRRLAFANEIPSSLKNPHALTISLNGTSQGPYDGSAAKSINITPGSIGAATSGHNHDGRYVYNYGGTPMDGSSRNKNALGMSTTSGISGDWWHILQAAWNDEYRWNSQIAFPTQNRNGMYYRSGLDDNTKWGAWVKLLDTGNSSISGNTITINGSSLTVSKYDHNHDYLVVNEADEKSFNSAYHNFQVLYAGGGNGITGRPDNVDAFGLIRLRAAWGWSGQMLLANGGSLYIRSSADAQMTNTLAWRTILDSSNYSSILDSRYYTESEIDTKLAKKLDRVKLTTGSWNPRSYNLAADYHYNGGDLSISETGGQIHVSVDGKFWQNEGRYRVLDTSDITSIRGGLTLYQYLSSTDNNWFPLVWGGSDHKNTNNSTGSLYKSHDKLSWQTSSQTLYATNIRTENIKNLSIGGGIYWSPYVESATDGSDAASITVVKAGVAGGTTLVLSQQNDSNDTIQFKTSTAARLYHNSNQILTSGDTKVSLGKGYINNTEITQVNNSDTLDGWHKDNIQGTGYITSSNSLTSYWFKMYDITVTGYQYNDITITFLVSEGYSSNFSIFYLKIRQNGTNNSENYNLGVSLKELVGNLRDKVVAYYNNSTGNVQLWGNTENQWSTMNYTVIKKTTRTATDSPSLGTLTAQGFSSVQTPPSTGYTKLTMSRVGSVSYSDSTGSVHWNNVTNKPSTFNPAAHTHTWASITDKIVAGNEFNIVNAGFKESMWFNYLPINDRSKTAAVASYIMGNGAKGYASVQASGFIKHGSNSSYVLLGDGGHAAISGLSVNYANSANKLNKWFDSRVTDLNQQFGDGALRIFNATSSTTANKCPSDASILHLAWDNNGGWDTQLALATGGGAMYFRGQYNSTWNPWRTILHDGNSYVTDGKGIINGTTITQVSNADMVDGYHENSFLRYREATSKDQEATLWSQIGIKQYNNALPDNLTDVYNYGSVISLPGSSSRFEIYASHQASNGNGLYYRSGWGDDKKTWLKFIDSSNIGSQSVNHANSAGNADKLDGEHASSFVRAGVYNGNDLNKLDTYSFIRSVNSNNEDTSPKSNTGWYNVIQLVHRNGAGDGASYIGQIALGMTTNTDGMFFRGKRTDSWKTVIHSGNIGNQTVAYANNSDKVDGYHATDGRTFNGNINWSPNWNDSWSDGTNKHPWYGFDHRYANTGAYSTTLTDYFGMTIKTANTLRLDFGTLLLNGTSIYNINVASATKLQTARNLWGQRFDGTSDVNGTIYINNSDSSNGAIRLNNNVNANARISAIGGQVIFNTGAAIRFGEATWDWDKWAGLKYDSSTKTIYLGIADDSIFNANSAQGGGTINLKAGISTIEAPNISFGNVTSGLCNGLGWTCGDNDFARIKAGADGGSNGYLEIATADDGTEPIYVRQYTGNFKTIARTLTLLDANGNTYIPKQIIREASSRSWFEGRAGALLRETTSTGYHTLWSLKTTNGSWDFGEYNSSGWNNVPVMSYVTDSDFNAGNNTTTHQIKFPLDSGTVALTKNIPSKLPADGGNADTVDGYHANGLFTAFGNNGHNITATIGGVTKEFLVNYAADSDKLDGKHASDFASAGHNHDGHYVKIWGNVKANFNFPDNEDHSGVYMCHTTETQSNKPETYGLLTDFSTVNGHLQFFGASSNKIYARTYWWTGQTNFKYTDWHTLLHTGNSSVNGKTITINGTSTTWSNTWRPISDDYEKGDASTSLSTLGSLTLYNDLLGSIPNPTSYYWANIKVSSSSSTTTSPTVNVLTATRVCAGHDPGISNSISCSNWFRSSGETGWYSSTYGGGWYMSDKDWIRSWGSKALYINNSIRSTNYQVMYGSTSASAARLESTTTLVYGTDTSSNSINSYLRGTTVTLQVKKGTSINHNALQLTADYIYCNNYCDMKYGAAVSGGNLTVQNNSYLAQSAGAKVGIGTSSLSDSLSVNGSMNVKLTNVNWDKACTDKSLVIRKTTLDPSKVNSYEYVSEVFTFQFGDGTHSNNRGTCTVSVPAGYKIQMDVYDLKTTHNRPIANIQVSGTNTLQMTLGGGYYISGTDSANVSYFLVPDAPLDFPKTTVPQLLIADSTIQFQNSDKLLALTNKGVYINGAVNLQINGYHKQPIFIASAIYNKSSWNTIGCRANAALITCNTPIADCTVNDFIVQYSGVTVTSVRIENFKFVCVLGDANGSYYGVQIYYMPH